MSTEVILTGTGVPHPSPGRAGPGCLVRSGSTTLQVDAGRGTVLRLSDAGVRPHELDALLLTHVHSDHVVDVADLVMTRWIEKQIATPGPLPIVAPTGATSRFVERMLEAYEDDIALRMDHGRSPSPPELELLAFAAPADPAVVWRSADGSVEVRSVAVHHEPVDAVAYRIDTPDGAVVVSGDTRVCAEVEELSRGAAVVVHEACRASALAEAVAGTVFEPIFEYHADTVALGAMAERAGIGHLVLTHLIPPPTTEAERGGFAEDVRAGGFTGALTVGEDLVRISLG